MHAGRDILHLLLIWVQTYKMCTILHTFFESECPRSLVRWKKSIAGGIPGLGQIKPFWWLQGIHVLIDKASEFIFVICSMRMVQLSHHKMPGSIFPAGLTFQLFTCNAKRFLGYRDPADWDTNLSAASCTYIFGTTKNGMRLSSGVNILSGDPFGPSFQQKEIISKLVQKQKS